MGCNFFCLFFAYKLHPLCITNAAEPGLWLLFPGAEARPVSAGRTEPSGAGPQGATRGSLPSCSQASRPIAPFRGVMKTGKCVTFGGGRIRNIFNNCYRLMYFSFMCLIMILCVFRAGLLGLAVIYVLGQIIRGCRGLFCASQAV